MSESIELVVTTSSPTVTQAVSTDPSTSQYNETFGRALNGFENLMGQDHKPTKFESPDAVLEVLDGTVEQFNAFRAGNHGLKTWLESYVDLLFTVSEKIWESETTQTVSFTHGPLLPCYCTLTSLSHQPHSPEKTICNAIVVLIEVSLFFTREPL
jgi:hypothetical protein